MIRDTIYLDGGEVGWLQTFADSRSNLFIGNFRQS
jgi:hypothetical protein